MRRRIIVAVPLLLPMLFASPASSDHERCVGVMSQFFRQGLNFFLRGEVRNRCAYEVRDLRVSLEALDGERNSMEHAEYAVSPSSLAPGGMASFAGVVRAPEGSAVGSARVSWSHD